jgi:hypothetical protein
MFPVIYELGFYIPEYGNLHSNRRENLISYMIYYLFIELLSSEGSEFSKIKILVNNELNPI